MLLTTSSRMLSQALQENWWFEVSPTTNLKTSPLTELCGRRKRLQEAVSSKLLNQPCGRPEAILISRLTVYQVLLECRFSLG